jgi:hypothetical protein
MVSLATTLEEASGAVGSSLEAIDRLVPWESFRADI